jgi:hypothetical protein
VRGVSGTPGILCSARSEEKGWLQTCAGAYCRHSCALRINKRIPSVRRARSFVVFFWALCPVHGPMATAMVAVSHSRAQDQCRETTRREGRALLRAAIGYRLFLLLLAVRACSVRKRPCALALSSGSRFTHLHPPAPCAAPLPGGVEPGAQRLRHIDGPPVRRVDRRRCGPERTDRTHSPHYHV